MTHAITQPVAHLLAEFARLGIELQAHGDKMRYRPRSAMTPDLIERLKTNKPGLLTALAEAEGVAPATKAHYSPQELRLLTNAPEPLRATIDTIKATFADSGGATVVDVRPDSAQSRLHAARLIQDARRAGERYRAIDLRDAWHERVAICIVDEGLSRPQAEQLALADFRAEAAKGELNAVMDRAIARSDGNTKTGVFLCCPHSNNGSVTTVVMLSRSLRMVVSAGGSTMKIAPTNLR